MNNPIFYDSDGRRIGQPKADGTITMPIEFFPQEVIQRMMQNPGFSPVLKLEIPKLFLTDGLTMTSDSNGIDIELRFAAFEINIEET